MNRRKTIIYLALITVLLLVAGRLLTQPSNPNPIIQTQNIDSNQKPASSTAADLKKEPASSTAKTARTQPAAKNDPAISVASSTPNKMILFEVPFTSQAPFAEWSDPRFQYACEEASVLMAIRWAEGLGPITKADAKAEILDMVAYEEKTINNYRDTSASDTLDIIINGYFKYMRAELKKDSDIAAIKNELYKGNILILPMNGKKMNNPNFTHGGPEEHMLVIRGYDPATKEFITNDPGTRKGESYRYPEKIIEAAWRDYPTGDHAPISGIARNMIIVRKK
jgi:hypothetical protein